MKSALLPYHHTSASYTRSTAGEDMFLTSTHALNMVLGMQGCGNGSCLYYNTSVIAEPKHFVVHSIPECGSVACGVLSYA